MRSLKTITSVENCHIILEQCSGEDLIATSGTFDLFHIGHLKHLRNCKKLGKHLVVFISSDERVKQKKGHKRPIIPQHERAEIIDSFEIVDFVVIGDDPQPGDSADRTVRNLKILEILRPKLYIVPNKAWECERKKLKDWSIELQIKIEDDRIKSTTDIIGKIIDLYGQKKNKC